MDSGNRMRPIWYALVLVLGLLLGFYLSMRISGKGRQLSNSGDESKIAQLISYIQREYVDTISRQRLVEESMASIVENLDPHSAYIPASELAALNEPLQGNFEGIGIEFNLLKDTIYVVSALAGGPSEALGIRSGDRIVSVDGKNVAGIHITNNDVIKKLRGPGGTSVKVGILRRGHKGIMPFVIVRGKIPIYSVDTHYMLNAQTGYIKVSRFAQTTMEEFSKAMDNLLSQGMKKLVLDLRGNPGGLLNVASEMADVFLEGDKLIVYTKGRARARDDFYAGPDGNFQKGPLAILIDEGSASASEIVAGAIQDNDRGTIVGRRSFGKGLVQEQSSFNDGSAVRLTIARYYTPTGRCIQKPYTLGNAEEYMEDEFDRFTHGEFQHPDSIKFNDSLKYTTPKGKVVYGGGGIMPDIFVPADTSERTPLLMQLLMKGVFNQFCIAYAEQHRKSLLTYGDVSAFAEKFTVSESLVEEFMTFAEKEKVIRNKTQEKTSGLFIRNQLKALLARSVYRTEGYYRVLNAGDKTVKRAIQALEKTKS